MIYLLPHGIDYSAERFPDKEAFRYYDQSLTYAQLVRRANALAQTLQEQGVKRGDRVGIYLNKSLESAVSIYGILKAGAAYVPLDPMVPPSRLAFILKDCGIRHLITETNKRKTLHRAITSASQLDWVIGLPEEANDLYQAISWDAVSQRPSTSP